MHERLLKQPESLEDPQKFTREKSQLWSVTPLAKSLLEDITGNNFTGKTRSCNPELVTPLAKSVAETHLNKLGLSDAVVLRFATGAVLEEKMNPIYRKELAEKGQLKKELNANKAVTGYRWKKDVVIEPERKDDLSQALDSLLSDAHAAQQDIATAHIDLANKFAKSYLYKKKPAFDPVAEAYEGLTKAAQRFDWRCGYTFQEYAQSTIRGEITRALRDYGETVRKPRAVFDQTIHVLRAESELMQEGKAYDNEAIAKKIGVPVSSVEAVREYRSATSLETNIFPDSSKPTTIGETLSDPDANVEDNALDKASIKKAIDVLDPRSKAIIYKLFYEEKSQQEVGDEIGVSQMHISRLRKQALVKMRELLSDDEYAGTEKETVGKKRTIH